MAFIDGSHLYDGMYVFDVSVGQRCIFEQCSSSVTLMHYQYPYRLVSRPLLYETEALDHSEFVFIRKKLLKLRGV